MFADCDLQDLRDLLILIDNISQMGSVWSRYHILHVVVWLDEICMIWILHTCLPRWDLHDLEILHTCLRWWDLYDLYDLHIHAYLDGIYMICMICTRFSGEDLYDLDLMNTFSISEKRSTWSRSWSVQSVKHSKPRTDHTRVYRSSNCLIDISLFWMICGIY